MDEIDVAARKRAFLVALMQPTPAAVLDHISDDINELVNRYGNLGWAVLAFAMELGAVQLQRHFSSADKGMYEFLKKHCSAVSIAGSSKPAEGGHDKQ